MLVVVAEPLSHSNDDIILVAPGSQIVKTWTVSNDSKSAWPKDAVLMASNYSEH